MFISLLQITSCKSYNISFSQWQTTQREIIKKALGWEPDSKFVKLQLAPSGDFFFDAWKHASRTNINTTPVWQELVSEWHQLEKFIRRVAKVNNT